MTGTHAHAVFFGGPEDGATKLLSPEDFSRGYVEALDALGNPVRYSIVELTEAKNVEDTHVTYELRPTEGLW